MNILTIHLLAAWIVMFICVEHVIAGLSFMGSQKAPALPYIAPSIVPSIARAHDQTVSLAESFVKVKETIESLETMPSCKKLAARDLLQSCESFEDRRNGKESSGDEFLESYQKLFAIRVTNCEHLDANDNLPKACQPLLETNLRRNAPKQIISSCLAAMNSGHQSQWTTFNRVKLEGLIMCTAMRAEANKDDQIHLFKILFSTMNEVNGAISLQKDELEALTESFRGISNQMWDFQNSLLEDNQEIKAKVMSFTAELKGSMTDINEVTQMMMQAVTEANEELLNSASRMGSAMQMAISRSDETDTQWEVKVQTARRDLEMYKEQQLFFMQQFLDLFHAGVYNMSQSVDTANLQTSALASSLGELSIRINAPLQQLTNLNLGADELVAKHQYMRDSSIETIQALDATQKLAGDYFKLFDTMSIYIQGMLDHMGVFTLYFVLTFMASLYLMWRFVSRPLAPILALINGTYLSVFFTYVHSPIAFVRSVFANHPTFFSPVYWSVFCVVVVTILFWESAKQGYRYFWPSETGGELSLPGDEDYGVDEKV